MKMVTPAQARADGLISPNSLRPEEWPLRFRQRQRPSPFACTPQSLPES